MDAHLHGQPPEFWQGVAQFNQGEFYACHDTLEAIWIEAMDPDKTFYQGILQIAVGIYHLSHLNWRGAAILLGEGINRLNQSRRICGDDYGGIAVDQLVAEGAALLQAVQQVGEAGLPLLAAQLGLRSVEEQTEDLGEEMGRLGNADGVRLPAIIRL